MESRESSTFCLTILNGLKCILSMIKKCTVGFCRCIIRTCRESEESQRLNDQEGQRINFLQNRIRQLESEKTSLERQKKSLQKWHQPDMNNLTTLRNTRSRLCEHSSKTGEMVSYNDSAEEKMFTFFEEIAAVFIQMLEGHLHDLLTAPDHEDTTGITRNSKEQYRAYGLLLHACDGRIANKKLKFENIILQKYPFPQDHDQGYEASIKEKYPFLQRQQVIVEPRIINPSVNIINSMLTLLPPLLLIQPQWQHDDLQDTNRKTWDEQQRGQPGRPLIYYRPVMVFGNQLNVATRGLVGNSNQDSDNIIV